jgi:hypothetical protein
MKSTLPTLTAIICGTYLVVHAHLILGIIMLIAAVFFAMLHLALSIPNPPPQEPPAPPQEPRAHPGDEG